MKLVMKDEYSGLPSQVITLAGHLEPYLLFLLISSIIYSKLVHLVRHPKIRMIFLIGSCYLNAHILSRLIFDSMGVLRTGINHRT
jgi:hypothetical protein